jgi:hypothetical protein
MSSPLERLAALDDSIHAETPVLAEYEGLLRSGRMRLDDARRPEKLPREPGRPAYNASHALCLAALRRSGYRSSRRFVVFEAVPHTLGLGPEVWMVLTKCHRIRNQAEYEGIINLNARIVTDLIEATSRVLAALEALGPPG